MFRSRTRLRVAAASHRRGPGRRRLDVVGLAAPPAHPTAHARDRLQAQPALPGAPGRGCACSPPTGLAAETVAEAAHRAGLALEWREIPAGPDEALTVGSADLWPLVTDLPERRGKFYISEPWLQSQHVLVLREGRPLPGPEFAEPVGITAVTSHVRQLREVFPQARPVLYPEGRDALGHLCASDVVGVFLETRLALAVLHDPPSECTSVKLQAHLLPDNHRLGVGSTFEASGAADRIRREISNLAANGTLAVLLARHSLLGLNERAPLTTCSRPRSATGTSCG